MAIGDYLGGALKVFQMTMRSTEVIQSTDDDVIVATYSSKGVVTTTKKAYENRYGGIFTFRNGRVLSQVEYYNPLPRSVH
jgi:ketosteroid isomerase-like protein